MKTTTQQPNPKTPEKPGETSTPATARETHLANLSDEELTALFVNESQAFVALYNRYVTRMYSYFAWRFGTNNAEDLTADVFTRALTARSKFKQGKMWRPWLFGIARNRALEHLRSLKKDSPNPEFKESDVREHAPDISTEVEHHEQADALRQLVSSLPEGQREVIELRFWAGLSYREISEILGGTEGALRVQTHRVLHELRNRLEGKK